MEVLYGPPSPAGFWRREFGPPPYTKRGLRLPPLNFFTASLFQRGKKWKESSAGCRKTLLPLEKGGREGFLVKAFQRAKVIQLFLLTGIPIIDNQNPKGLAAKGINSSVAVLRAFPTALPQDQEANCFSGLPKNSIPAVMARTLQLMQGTRQSNSIAPLRAP